MNNKKGFTLIEILATIVILSIVLIIAVPIILAVGHLNFICPTFKLLP